jgi:hypothetical protein
VDFPKVTVWKFILYIEPHLGVLGRDERFHSVPVMSRWLSLSGVLPSLVH